MVSWFKGACLFLLICLTLTAKLKSPTKQEQTQTVLQANHFMSTKQLSASYDIKQVKEDLSLLVILRPKNDDDKEKSIKNPIEIKLVSSSKEVTCNFNNYNSVCAIDKTTPGLKMKIKCTQLPCQVYWTIYQANLKVPKQQQDLGDLYELPQNNYHSIAVINCNSPDIKNFQDSIQIYSDTPFTQFKSVSAIYVLFKNHKKGYIYVKSTKQAQACAKFGFYKVKDTIKQDQDIKDFIQKDQTSIFKLKQVPKSVFRIDSSLYRFIPDKDNKTTSLKIVLTGQKDSKRQQIRDGLIKPDESNPNIQFSYVIPKVSSDYKNLQLQFKSTYNPMLLNFQLSLADPPQVQAGQVTFFTLNKGQKLQYQLMEEKQADQKQKVTLYPQDDKKIAINQTQCNMKKGCKFTVTALENTGTTGIFIGTNLQSKTQEAVFLDVDKSVTKKIKMGQIQYYKKIIPAKHSFQVVVNSPNVIIYAASKKKCQKPSLDCHQQTGNNHRPFIYQATQQTQFRMAVQGLDSCQFTLTIIMSGQQFIELQDNVAFSYLFDQRQQELSFKFKIKEKAPVSFNLISSLHQLNMFISNSDQKPKGDQSDLQSVDGFISYKKKEVQSLTFTILISKTKLAHDKYVHFSLIASTKGSNMRLEPGIAHYQTLAKQESRQYVFQFEKEQEYVLNFYTHNSKNLGLDINVKVSNKDDNWKDQKVQTFSIESFVDHLNLKDVSQTLCKQQGQTNCQIFLKITNSMQEEIDMTLTLVVAHSIIQMKDGLWQSYVITDVASSSHFYFFPRHIGNSVSIIYRSTFSDLRIAYSIWRAQDKTLNPTSWPFPKSTVDFQKTGNVFTFRPTKHIQISNKALQQCWPSCVILLSLVKDTKAPVRPFIVGSMTQDSFSILISNNFIEIPQKTKLDIVVEAAQQKLFLIDLKYIMSKKAITIFTSTTIGYPSFTGTVYTQSNPRCPTDQQSDFSFGRLQTQIQTSTIKQKMAANNMDDSKDNYICLKAKAFSQTKFYIEWDSDEQLIKVLELDSFETIAVNKQISKIYQITPRQQQYQLKFLRTRGFPFIHVTNCQGTGSQDYQKCLAELKKQKGKQMVTKTQLFSQKACADCIIFVQISAQQPAQLQLHVQSQYSQIQLKANVMLSDFIETSQKNKYMVTYIPKQQAVISIHILQGVPLVTITDFLKININKTKDGNSDMIHIVIPAEIHQTAQQQLKLDQITKKTNATLPMITSMLGQTFFGSYGLNGAFKHLHVTVESKDKNVPTSYTITYSSGARQIYLQDGLFADYILEPQKQTTFYYQNIQQQDHIYLAISMPDSASLYNLKIRMYYFQNPQDQDSKKQFTPTKPPMRKKTQNPTMLFLLPNNNKLYSFSLLNTQSKSQKVSLVINHLQVMLLPFNSQFPIQMHAKQDMNLLVDVITPGHLLINIRKCDQSSPSFGYTFDQKAFQKGQFNYQTQLNDDPNFQFIVKATQVGTLYMRIETIDEPSILSIKVSYSQQKIKGSKAKPGNKGILEYQLLNSQEAEISFVGAVCPNGKCPNDISYFTISATDMPTLYTQTVCPASYFSTTDTKSLKPLTVTKIESKADSNNKISFTYKLLDHLSYVGVKGIYTGGQIYYRPIEIVTLWGQLSRTSHSHKFAIGSVIVISLCALLICVRRYSKQGYKPLKEEND